MKITTQELRNRYKLSRKDAVLFKQRDFADEAAMDAAMTEFKSSEAFKKREEKRNKATPAPTTVVG
jgi:hypothetical protein